MSRSGLTAVHTSTGFEIAQRSTVCRQMLEYLRSTQEFNAWLWLQTEEPDDGDRVLDTAFMHPSYVDTPDGSNLAICTPKNVYNVRFGAPGA